MPSLFYRLGFIQHRDRMIIEGASADDSELESDESANDDEIIEFDDFETSVSV